MGTVFGETALSKLEDYDFMMIRIRKAKSIEVDDNSFEV